MSVIDELMSGIAVHHQNFAVKPLMKVRPGIELPHDPFEKRGSPMQGVL